jgi:hypothetical protein
MPKEPEYHGKKLSEWLKDAGKGNAPYRFMIFTTTGSRIRPFSSPPGTYLSGVKSQQASDYGREAIKSIGTNAIPFIIPMLLAKDSSVRGRLDPWIHKWSWLESRSLSPSAQRQRGMAAMVFLEKDAVPSLITLFDDEATPIDVRCFAAYTFQRLPEHSIEALAALKRGQSNQNLYFADLSRKAVYAIEKE